MASRYWVGGSGNWTDTSHWSASLGGSGGASVPTIGDTVRLTTNNTVTINQDINVYAIYNSDGQSPSTLYTPTIINSSYNVFTESLIYLVANTTISAGSGIWRSNQINVQGSTISNANQATFEILQSGVYTPAISLPTNGVIGTVKITFTRNTSPGLRANIYLFKSPQTITTLIIDAAGYTGTGVNIVNNYSLYMRRLIAKDSRIYSSTSGVARSIIITGSNQLVATNNIILKDISISGSGTYYAGSTSTNEGNNSGWLFADAPKVETFSDSFPGSSIDTNKWTASNTIGVYSGWSGIRNTTNTEKSGTLVSKSQYLGEGSSLWFKSNITTGMLFAYFCNASGQYGVAPSRNIPLIYVQLTSTTGTFYLAAASIYTSTSFSNDYSYYRIRESSGTIYLDGSNDGIVYTNIKSVVAADYGLETTQLITRPEFYYYTNSIGDATVSQFNINQEPTAQFIGVPVSGNTPMTVNFTDQSNFSPTSWNWDFGDSTTSTSQNPSKTYSAPGIYTVSLISSNTTYTRSIIKTDYITVNPNIYNRSISGSLLFGGNLSRKLLATRSISGSLLFGGSVNQVTLVQVEALQDKRYLYKVYDESGNFIDIWKDVVSELSFTHEINSIGSTTSIELARNSDTVGTVSSNLLTESNQNILAEDDLPLLAVTESKNQIGPGSSVDYNNRVDIYAFYGSTGPLQTEDYESIITEDDEEILADLGHPNGIRVFTGFISEINSRYGNTETTIVQLSSYGWDTDQFPLMKSGATTVTYNSYDPSDIAKDAIDQFVTDSSSYGTYTHRDSISIATSGTTVSYTFKSNTYKEVMDKVLELLPSNWYYRVGLGDNIVYYSSRSSTADHLFYLGKHIKALDLKGSILDVVNRVLFTGGGDPALYLDRSEAPADRTRRALKVMSDNRVTLTDSAEIIIDSNIDQNNKTQYRTTIEILSSVYDIESINVGQTIGFRNFGNYVDALTMQIVGLSYTPESVQLQLETKPPTINKRLEDIRRNLTVTENQNLPTSPS